MRGPGGDRGGAECRDGWAKLVGCKRGDAGGDVCECAAGDTGGLEPDRCDAADDCDVRADD